MFVCRGPRDTRDMTAVSSTAQYYEMLGMPLHVLCNNTSVTAAMIQALGALHPAAAGEKPVWFVAARATRAI